MTKEDLIERIKTTNCAVVVAQYRPDSAEPLTASVRGRPDMIAQLLAELLHNHTVTYTIPATRRDTLTERESSALYAKTFADAAQHILMSIQLRLSMLSELPEPADPSALLDNLDAAALEHNYILVAPLEFGVLSVMYSSRRAELLSMISEAIWQVAIAHVNPSRPTDVEAYATKIIGIMRSYSEARYLLTLDNDRQRRQSAAHQTADEPTPPDDV